jgi:hypothetical protein
MYAINAELTERYGPLRWRREIPGLRLEMHPSTRYLLYQDPELWEYGTFAEPLETFIPRTFGIPFKITTDVEKDHWRLVIVTEEVLLGGTLRVGETDGPDKPDAQQAG